MVYRSSSGSRRRHSSLPRGRWVLLAHVDETSAPLGNGARICALAAVLTQDADQVAITGELSRLLLPQRPFLHHYDETSERRAKLAERISSLPLTGALVVARTASDTSQEAARRKLLSWLLPHLEHVELVDQVVIESRGGSDRLDRRTRDRLRRSRRITTSLRVDHTRKHDEPRLWLADFVAGSWASATYRSEGGTWSILCAARP